LRHRHRISIVAVIIMGLQARRQKQAHENGRQHTCGFLAAEAAPLLVCGDAEMSFVMASSMSPWLVLSASAAASVSNP
jgi:hypothetical protein